MLQSLYRDWVRAPISGTAVIACVIGSVIWFPADRALLYLILGAVIAQGRGRNDAEEG